MESFIQNNFMMSVIIGVVAVIAGAALAFQADNKFGYVVLAGGGVFILYSMRVFGLI